MHRIDTKTAQKDKFGAGKNGFTRGNPQTGTPATDLDDDYFDMLQEELCSVVEASGASLEKGRHDQLLTALRALLLSRKNPFGDIKSDGTVKTALENLDLITNGAVGRLMGPPKRFTSSGTYTPTAGTKFIIVEQVGGGGGGGGVPATSSTAYTASAGGGAGAYASGIFTSGFSGVTVTIGAGGTGGPAGANTGGNGGTTSFGSLLIAPGGVGGGPGVAGMTTPHMVPNGGASAEPTGANIVGFAGVASTTAFAYTIGNIIGSSGASCPFGTGGWQPSASGFRSGSGFGSGASGSNQGPSLAAAAGGSGQPGVVIVWEYA